MINIKGNVITDVIIIKDDTDGWNLGFRYWSGTPVYCWAILHKDIIVGFCTEGWVAPEDNYIDLKNYFNDTLQPTEEELSYLSIVHGSDSVAAYKYAIKEAFNSPYVEIYYE